MEENSVLFCEHIAGGIGWLKSRSELYSKIAEWENKELDDVLFEFAPPQYGWIDTVVRVNGKKIYDFPISNVWNPFLNMKIWMEEIMSDKLSSEMVIDCEGGCLVFHYERFRCDNGIYDPLYNGSYENEDNCSTGLFYIYSNCGRIVTLAYCNTKKLVYRLYSALLKYASLFDNSRFINSHWGYSDDGNKSIPANWSFYNIIKSSLVEWHFEMDGASIFNIKKLKKSPTIRNCVHLLCGVKCDELFLDFEGNSCGNTDGFAVSGTDFYVDLSDIPELKSWCEEDKSLKIKKCSDEDRNDWFMRGWRLAKEIRKRMPADVDLFYEWRHFKRKSGKNKEFEDVFYVVPDERLVKINNSRVKTRKLAMENRHYDHLLYPDDGLEECQNGNSKDVDTELENKVKMYQKELIAKLRKRSGTILKNVYENAFKGWINDNQDLLNQEEIDANMKEEELLPIMLERAGLSKKDIRESALKRWVVKYLDLLTEEEIAKYKGIIIA